MKRLLLFLLLIAAANTGAASKPNIIFILAGDLGLDGLTCYGGERVKTPHLDALAAGGVRFTNCYATPLCGPSRCTLMTGRYVFRTGGRTNQSAGNPSPRDWIFVQLNNHWYARDARFKLTETGALFDLQNAPFEELPVAVASRQRLQAVLDKLKPTGTPDNQPKRARKKRKL